MQLVLQSLPYSQANIVTRAPHLRGSWTGDRRRLRLLAWTTTTLKGNELHDDAYVNQKIRKVAVCKLTLPWRKPTVMVEIDSWSIQYRAQYILQQSDHVWHG